MKGLIPVIMSGILGIFGLIVSIIISSNVTTGVSSWPNKYLTTLLI